MKWHLRTAVLASTCIAFVALESHAADAVGRANSTWDRYLDYAYIYTSASMPELETRLGEYALEAGISLHDYLVELRTLSASEPTQRSARTRRLAIGNLLEYLASGDPQRLESSVDAIDALAGQQGRHEDRYWYRYIHAHRALESNDPKQFVGQIFGLWFEGVAPLESSFDTAHKVSLDRSSSVGFAGALPYLYENVARLILLRSRDMGVDQGLDPLAAVVRLLHDGRLGEYPRVVPENLSAKAFLDRIMARLEGTASDGGRLSFTLALFEATRDHEKARALLASEGFSDGTIEAFGIASGSYSNALEQARTVLGKSAVYVHTLRQLGEIHAAKQRLAMDPDVYAPFRIEDAVEIYRRLHAAREDAGWMELGFRNTAADAYVETLHRLWAEIQEAGMNLADYHLSRSQADPDRANAHLRSAEKIYVRYLALHREFGEGEGNELVPNSGTFGVYEAAKGFGDIHLLYSPGDPTPSVTTAVTEHYLLGLRAFPFDREIWGALAQSVERQDRGGEFLGYAQPIANVVESSRLLQNWIAMGRAGEAWLARFKRVLSDDRAILMLGLVESGDEVRLADELVELRTRREELDLVLAAFVGQLDQLDRLPIGEPLDALAAEGASDLPNVSLGPPSTVGVDRESLVKEIASTESRIRELDTQIEGFTRALPLFVATQGSEEFGQALRAQRDHPAHGLLRKLSREMSPVH